MKRIVVIGCPGSGKSTFARKLSKKVDLPLFHLDFYYHDDKIDYTVDKVAWKKLTAELIAKDQWIIDGNYKSTLELRMAAADTVIFFDYPRYLTVWRTLKRRLQYHGKQRPDMPSNWKEKIEPTHAKFVWQFNKLERPKIYSYLDKHKEGREVVVFKHSRDTENWLDSITSR